MLRSLYSINFLQRNLTMKEFQSLVTILLLCLCMSVKGHAVKTLKVAEDNDGLPVKIGYVAKGSKSKPAMLIIDPFFGTKGGERIQKEYQNNFYTISIDPPGFGFSSKNRPEAMDGVLGELVEDPNLAGYSTKQLSALIHEFLKQMDVKGPIVWLGIDFYANVGMRYASEYASDQLSISHLVMTNFAPHGIVSGNPCALAFLTPEIAQGIVTGLSNPLTRCATLCNLLQLNFVTAKSSEASQIQLQQSVRYLSSTTSEIIARLYGSAYQENLAPLMPQIETKTLCVYGTSNDFNPVSRRAAGMSFIGYCPTCIGISNNPFTLTSCHCESSYIHPFPDIRLIVIPGHGSGVHLTSKAFRTIYKDFVSNKDDDCDFTNFEVEIPEKLSICTGSC